MKHIQQFIPSLSETNQFSKDLINLDRRNPIEFEDSVSDLTSDEESQQQGKWIQ